jgi:signal transduction histidine kinase
VNRLTTQRVRDAPAHRSPTSAAVANRPITTALGWRLPSWLLDYGPVVLIVLVGLVGVAKHAQGSGIADRAPVLLVTVIVIAVALALRHGAPVAVLGLVLAISLGINVNRIAILAVLFALFTVAEYSGRATVVGAAAMTAAVLLVTPPLHDESLQGLGPILSRLVAVGLAVAVGLYLRTRAEYVTGLQDRAARLERERELLAHQAVADERLRIARELHDVVAHNVSLMVVQSQALAATRPGNPSEHEALHRVADLGREALSEMHRMLGVLRPENGTAPEREPQPGVRDLERLIAGTRETGLDVTLSVTGAARELPPGVDLSAFRIVQEALTNVIRHAGAEHAAVRLSYLPGTLEVSVLDDGCGGPHSRSNGAGRGHGLVGMRERVALFGGRLHAGARTDAPGYCVIAALPLR